MELHRFLSETPTTTSSCSTDPLYDNCAPFAQRVRAGEQEVERRLVCLAVTRLPGPRGHLLGLAPAEAPAPVSGGRGFGTWPDHNYRSWRGGLGTRGWEAEPDMNVNRARGGEGAGGGGGGRGGAECRAHLSRSPSPSQSEMHRSALSLYDNLCDPVTPDDLQKALGMDASFREHLQEQMNGVWAPEEVRGLMGDGGEGKDTSTWSSRGIPEQDQHLERDEKQEKEPELNSGSWGFRQGDHMLHLDLPVSPPRLPQLSHILWSSAGTQHAKLPSWWQRVPPPVPLADPSARALRSLITSLQQQIVRQREEYESRIIRLEQRNEELQAEVFRLKTNLSQQQHWYQVVQAKIAESEKDRTAAELRNATLQKEMDQFFDTFGELNNEAKKTECIVKSF